MRAENIQAIPPRVWREIGGKAATKIVKDSDNGIGTKLGTNKRYKFTTVPYSEKYALKKAAGKAGLKGVSTSKQTNPPNLRLTGTMLGSIKAQNATIYGVDIVFGEGLKVKGNADMGRNIYGINVQNEKEIVKNLSNYMGKQIKKYAKKPIKLNIG